MWSAVADDTLYVVAYKELGSTSYLKFETKDTHALLMSLEPKSRYLVNIFLDISQVQADDESKWMSFTTPEETHQPGKEDYIIMRIYRETPLNQLTLIIWLGAGPTHNQVHRDI